MHQVIELQFDDQTENLLQNARVALHQQGLIPQPEGLPHISLSSFETGNDRTWETCFNRIAEQRVLPIDFSRVNVFSGPNPVIYLGVPHSPRLQQLHAQIHEQAIQKRTELHELYFPERIIFHITLGMPTNTEVLPRALKLVSTLELPKNGYAVRLSLVEYSPAKTLLEKEFHT